MLHSAGTKSKYLDTAKHWNSVKLLGQVVAGVRLGHDQVEKEKMSLIDLNLLPVWLSLTLEAAV